MTGAYSYTKGSQRWLTIWFVGLFAKLLMKLLVLLKVTTTLSTVPTAPPTSGELWIKLLVLQKLNDELFSQNCATNTSGTLCWVADKVVCSIKVYNEHADAQIAQAQLTHWQEAVHFHGRRYSQRCLCCCWTKPHSNSLKHLQAHWSCLNSLLSTVVMMALRTVSAVRRLLWKVQYS